MAAIGIQADENPHADGKRLYLCPAGVPEVHETARQLSHFGYATRLFDDLSGLLEGVRETPPAGVLMDCGALRRHPEMANQAVRAMAASIPLACMSNHGDIGS